MINESDNQAIHILQNYERFIKIFRLGYQINQQSTSLSFIHNNNSILKTTSLDKLLFLLKQWDNYKVPNIQLNENHIIEGWLVAIPESFNQIQKQFCKNCNQIKNLKEYFSCLHKIVTIFCFVMKIKDQSLESSNESFDLWVISHDGNPNKLFPFQNKQDLEYEYKLWREKILQLSSYEYMVKLIIQPYYHQNNILFRIIDSVFAPIL